MKSLFKATAAVTLLKAAAVAASSYVSSPRSAGFLSSPPFLWVAANVIIIWLLSSSRRGGRTSTAAATSSAGGHAADVIHSVDNLYPSSEYEGVVGVSPRGEAAVSKRQAREARTAARRADRPGRLRRKSAGEGEPSPRAVTAEKRGEEVRGTVAAGEARPDAGDDDADVSMDSLWHSIVQRRAARPVAVRKSETWGSYELPRLQREAETAVARREMRKSVSAARAPPPPPQAAPASAARQLGWRTREVLVVPPQDDLLRRAESLIRRHHDHLRLQR